MDARTNTTNTFTVCSCGNSTSTAGKPVAGSTCNAPPAAGNYTNPPAACIAGTGSCPCSANASQACGLVGVGRVYRGSCVPAEGPGEYVCPLRGGRYMSNGSDVPYQRWVDCFGQSILDGILAPGESVIKCPDLH